LVGTIQHGYVLNTAAEIGRPDPQIESTDQTESTDIESTDKEKYMAAAKLTQTQVIKELAGATGTSTKVAKQFVTSFSDLAVRETKKNGMFVIPGIGRLVRVDRKARMGRNPATGEAIKIPAKKVVKFRVAKAVKDAIVPPKKK
jgi:DNA-binding protein HU-beta